MERKARAVVLIGLTWRRFGEWWRNTEDRWLYVEGWTLGALMAVVVVIFAIGMIR
jgi:hypothetical protein